MAADGSGSRMSARVFRAIWQHPHISRVEIARNLGIEKSTVTVEVNKLLEQGLVEETKEGDASRNGGRKPIQLAICSTAGRIIGIDLQSDSYRAIAVDLLGNVLCEHTGDIDIDHDNFVKSAIHVIKECARKLKGDSKLLGVGVGMSGLIDSRHSNIRYSLPFGITEPIDFAKEIAGKLTFPCFIQNDADCCACGELAFNRSEDLRNFLFALVKYNENCIHPAKRSTVSVGLGVVFNGKVFTGTHGCTGEFRSVLCDEAGTSLFSLEEKDLARMMTDRKILDKLADELARNIAFIVNIIDFDRVFIGGSIQTYDIDLPGILRSRLKDNWMYPEVAKNIKVTYSSLGSLAVAYGAAGMTFERLVTDNSLPAR